MQPLGVGNGGVGLAAGQAVILGDAVNNHLEAAFIIVIGPVFNDRYVSPAGIADIHDPLRSGQNSDDDPQCPSENGSNHAALVAVQVVSCKGVAPVVVYRVDLFLDDLAMKKNIDDVRSRVSPFRHPLLGVARPDDRPGMNDVSDDRTRCLIIQGVSWIEVHT